MNRWIFFYLVNQSDEVVINWCVRNGLIASELQCPTCEGQMNLARRGSKATGFSFRCKTNKTHEVASRKVSFFMIKADHPGHNGLCEVLLRILHPVYEEKNVRSVLQIKSCRLGELHTWLIQGPLNSPSATRCSKEMEISN